MIRVEDQMAIWCCPRIGRVVGSVAGLLVLAGAARADGYRADEFLTLDLGRAVLSPQRLAPDATFVRVPVAAQAEVKTSAAPVRTAHVSRTAPHRVVQHRDNPLNAQASAPRPRIQLWYSCATGLCSPQR